MVLLNLWWPGCVPGRQSKGQQINSIALCDLWRFYVHLLHLILIVNSLYLLLSWAGRVPARSKGGQFILIAFAHYYR
ncbi:hypothetical protein DIU36_15335 [Mucilaginibacter rubeus]|nr:hypothetical protein DIU36_15335 [Mucilaginibacter rubeus]